MALTNLLEETLASQDEHIFYGSKRHKGILATITSSSFNEVRDAQLLLIKYLEIYITKTAQQAELYTNLPIKSYFSTFLEMRSNAQRPQHNGAPIPPEADNSINKTDYSIARYKRIREEFYDPEITLINKYKKDFEYSQEVFSAIDKACENLFEKLKKTGWLNQHNNQWKNDLPNMRASIIMRFAKHFDDALKDSGMPDSKINIIIDDSLESFNLGRLETGWTENYQPITTIRLNETYIFDKKTKMENALAAVLHEKIHGIFTQLAGNIKKCDHDNPEKEPFYNDITIAFLRKTQGIGAGISLIDTLYNDDSEEIICFGQDYDFEKKCSYYFADQEEREQCKALPQSTPPSYTPM